MNVTTNLSKPFQRFNIIIVLKVEVLTQVHIQAEIAGDLQIRIK